MVILASCNSDKALVQQELTQEEIQSNDVMPVSLSITSPTTKATEINQYEETINSLQVVILTKNAQDIETYDSYYSFSPEDDFTIYINPNRTDVAEYRILVYVNQPPLEGEQYNEDWVLFNNESASGFQMFGEESVTTTEIAEKNNEININVTRHCSKVEVQEIAVDWTNSANSLKSFKLKGIYLMDVLGAFHNLYELPSDVSSDYTLWHNRSGHNSSSHDALLYDKIENISVTESASYKSKHFLYGYISDIKEYNDQDLNNWIKGGTRLVIEAEFNGKNCYYAIPINELDKTHNEAKGILTGTRNKAFIFNKITITKPGSEHPYSPLPDESPVSVSITVDTWTDGYTGDYIIE